MSIFDSEEDRKEFHRSLIKDRENHVRFIEGVIKSNQDMAKLYKSGTFPGDKDMWKSCNAEVKKWKVYLKEAKEKLTKGEMEFNEKYLTIKEKAFNKGLTVISGGLCENV